MDKLTFILVIISFCVMPELTEGHKGQQSQNFVVRSFKDGRHILRVAYKGILGIESVASDFGRDGIFWREATDGQLTVMLLYQGRDQLLTCAIRKKPEDVKRFMNTFKLPGRDGFTPENITTEEFVHLNDQKVMTYLGRHGNLTTDNTGVDGGLFDLEESVDWVDFRSMVKTCRGYYRTVKKGSRTEEVMSQEANEDADLQIDRQTDRRRKRATERYNIYPGTKWCGYKNIGDHYHDLGENRNPDKCCRTHDHCPFSIAPFKKKYGYRNYSWIPILHCDCDERFRTCLKFLNSPVADNVGLMFFNLVRNKCFVLNREDVCVKRSFWGRCTQYKKRFRAEVLEPLEY